MQIISPNEAAKRLLLRQAITDHLGVFALLIPTPNVPRRSPEEIKLIEECILDKGDWWCFHPAHHKLMYTELQECMETPYGRLMFFFPPGSAKSTGASVQGPSWFMGKYPGSQLILASYALPLAKRHGTRARTICNSDPYYEWCGARVSGETGGKELWALDNESEYMAGGILTGITGNRAIGMMIDDPVKNMSEAQSPIIRDKIRSEYDSSLKTRFIPGAWLVIMQTRWDIDDLSGSILPEDYKGESGLIKCRDGFEWKVVNVPAKNVFQDVEDPLGRPVGPINPEENPPWEEAKKFYLWNEWFDERHWMLYENIPGNVRSPDAKTWWALYQQRPKPATGNLFERDWVNWYKAGEHPDYLNFYCSSDYALSDGKGDVTEHGVGGLDQDGNLWIVDWWHGQMTPDHTIDALLDLTEKWKVKEGFDESGLIEKAIKPQFEMRKRLRGSRLRIHYLPAIGNKVARFTSFRGMASAGKVYIPDTPWGHRLVDQLCAFRVGATIDDAVDVCSGFGRGLENMQWSRAKVPQTRPVGLQFGSWEWLTYEEGSDRSSGRVM
jgi:predicted phage terminase large subunit-like protein